MILGLDLSLTASGMVVLDNKTIVKALTVGQSLKRTSTQKEKIERLTFIAQRALSLIKTHNVKEVAIEGFAYGARGAQNDLGELHGVIKTQIYLAFRIVPEVISPTRARKLVFNKGNIAKADILDRLTKQGYKVSDHNQGDALVIALALRRLSACQS